jgi:hypothetical protein
MTGFVRHQLHAHQIAEMAETQTTFLLRTFQIPEEAVKVIQYLHWRAQIFRFQTPEMWVACLTSRLPALKMGVGPRAPQMEVVLRWGQPRHNEVYVQCHLL